MDEQTPFRNHWTARKKAAVVIAIRTGELSREEACRRYEMDPAELASWERAFDSGVERVARGNAADKLSELKAGVLPLRERNGAAARAYRRQWRRCALY